MAVVVVREVAVREIVVRGASLREAKVVEQAGVAVERRGASDTVLRGVVARSSS
jgi:hypothetical protein